MHNLIVSKFPFKLDSIISFSGLSNSVNVRQFGQCS